jgi:hypothetical protein
VAVHAVKEPTYAPCKKEHLQQRIARKREPQMLHLIKIQCMYCSIVYRLYHQDKRRPQMLSCQPLMISHSSLILSCQCRRASSCICQLALVQAIFSCCTCWCQFVGLIAALAPLKPCATVTPERSALLVAVSVCPARSVINKAEPLLLKHVAGAAEQAFAATIQIWSRLCFQNP